jgi:hypothetical protein
MRTEKESEVASPPPLLCVNGSKTLLLEEEDDEEEELEFLEFLELFLEELLPVLLFLPFDAFCLPLPMLIETVDKINSCCLL